MYSPRWQRWPKAWEFNAPLEKQGWTEAELGTRVRPWTSGRWSYKSYPVNYVAGGYYIVAMEDTADAHLLSPEGLNIDLTEHTVIRLRMQNHTSSERMRVRFTTDAGPQWTDAQSKVFDVTPRDNTPHVYTLDMGGVPGWKGRLRQFRLDFSVGGPVSGTCRIDYVWLGHLPR